LLREDNGELYLAAAQNWPPVLADNPRRMEGDCYCLDTFLAGDLEGAANVNIITCTRLKRLIDGTADCVPTRACRCMRTASASAC
jgi:two-component system NarL family sensor kinase